MSGFHHLRPSDPPLNPMECGTFDRATPNGKLQSHEFGIRQAAFVQEVVPLRAHRLAVAASTEALYGRNDLLHLTSQQYTALLRTPVAARFRTSILAQGRHLPKVVYGMIQVQQFIHLLGC